MVHLGKVKYMYYVDYKSEETINKSVKKEKI